MTPGYIGRHMILTFVAMRRPHAQLFKPALPDDLYINFRVTLDRITFTAIALHPTSTSGAAAAMRGLRERAARPHLLRRLSDVVGENVRYRTRRQSRRDRRTGHVDIATPGGALSRRL